MIIVKAATIIRNDYRQAEHYARSLGDLGDYLDFGVGRLTTASGLDNDQAKHELRRFVEQCRPASPETRAFLDTTTLMNVQQLFMGEEPELLTADTLMDLATFVDAVVFNDIIVHLPKRDLDTGKLNELLGDGRVLHELPVGPVSLEADRQTPQVAWLWELWRQTQARLGELANERPEGPYYSQRQAIQQAWGRLTDGLLADRDIFAVKFLNETWMSEVPQAVSQLLDQRQRSCEEQRMRALRQGADDPSIDELASIASEQNHRAHFNSELTHALGVRYLPNTLRRPYQPMLDKLSLDTQRQIDLTLADWLGAAFRKKVAESRGTLAADFAPLPPFLTAALAGASRPTEVIERIAELRGKARSLRLKRRELERAIQLGNANEIEPLTRAVCGEASKLWLLFAGAACGLVVTLAPLIDPFIMGAGTLALIGVAAVGREMLDASRWEELINRFRRRHLRVVRKVGNLARTMRNATPRAAEIWKLDRIEAARLQRRMTRVAPFGLAA